MAPPAHVGRKSVAFQKLNMGSKEDRAKALLEQAREMEQEEEEDIASGDPESKETIAMVCHDNMKPLLASFVKCYADILANFRLTGPSAVCSVLREAGLEPEDWPVPASPLGGDQVIANMIAEGNVKALFFFRDPLSSHAHSDDIAALTRIADTYQVYFSTNYRTGGAVLQNLNKKIRAARIARKMGKMGARASVCVPEELCDLGKAVHGNYLE